MPADDAKDKPAPPAQQALPASCLAPGYATWYVQIAPYLAFESSLQKWDMEQSYFVQPPEVRQAGLPMFFCPARVRPGFLSTAGDVATPGGKNVAGALGDYACASSAGGAKLDLLSAHADGAIIIAEVLEKANGRIVRWRSRTDFAALTRGQSHTILVGEKHVPYGEFGLASVGDGSIYNGQNPASFARAGGPGFPIAAGPTAPFHSNFGSYHLDLCQFLMADNSVRATQNDVSPEVLGKLIRRDD
jgi:hypothetical protein